MKATSQLADALSAGRPILLAEVLPPRGADRSLVAKVAAAIPKGVDAVVVADNPEEVRMSALACAAMLVSEKREAVLTMVTRDRNRIALESDILGAAAFGIQAILCISGVHQQKGPNRAAAGAYDIDSALLAQAVSKLAAEGVGFGNQRTDPPPSVFPLAVAHPALRPLDLNILQMKKKVAAGARALLTDAVFDVSAFEEWMQAVRAAGIDKKAAVVASVLPLRSVESALTLREKGAHGPSDAQIQRIRGASDPAREGLSLFAEISRAVRSTAGVRGVHVLSAGLEAWLPELVTSAGSA